MNHSAIHCNVCPAACCSWHYIPDCKPENPGPTFIVPDVKSNHHLFDFFGQFIKERNVRQLHAAARARYHDCLPLRCPECGIYLPLNATPDDYLPCAYCGTYWDLLPHRPVEQTTRTIKATLRPDGSVYRRITPQTGQMELFRG